MPKYYPVFLNLEGRRCVVVGAGREGERKVRKLLESEADVVVIAPEAGDYLSGLAAEGLVTWHRREYAPGDLEGAFIAISAAAPAQDNELNRAIAVEAEERSIPLVVIDVTHLCSFIAPSIVERGSVTIATSTGGSSPALARKFRQELSRSNVIEYADLAPLLRAARTELREREIRINADHWQASITEDVMGLIRGGSEDMALKTLMTNLMDGVSCDCPEGTCRMWDDETLSSRYAGRRASATAD